MITTTPRKVINSDVFLILTPTGQTSLLAEPYCVKAFIILVTGKQIGAHKKNKNGRYERLVRIHVLGNYRFQNINDGCYNSSYCEEYSDMFQIHSIILNANGVTALNINRFCV